MLMYMLPDFLCGEMLKVYSKSFFKAPNFKDYCCSVFKMSIKRIRSMRRPFKKCT